MLSFQVNRLSSLENGMGVLGVMCSREVDRDTGSQGYRIIGILDHINTTHKYINDQQLSTIIYQDAGSDIPSGYGQLNLTSQAHCNTMIINYQL
jgi:hypothetical protein